MALMSKGSVVVVDASTRQWSGVSPVMAAIRSAVSHRVSLTYENRSRSSACVNVLELYPAELLLPEVDLNPSVRASAPLSSWR